MAMLLQFSVKNFMSFKEDTTLSLIPNSGGELQGNIAKTGEYKALKSAVLFGANASGKTNFVKALEAAVRMIRESETIQLGELLFRIAPFKLDLQSAAKPSSFEFVFEMDGIKYVYGFSANIKRITEEYLYAYYSAKPTTIFERENDEYEFKADKKELEALAKRNNSNRLFLATTAAWNYGRTHEPFMWFLTMINAYEGDHSMQDISAFIVDDDGEQKKFTTKLLKIADINIHDYQVEKIDALMRAPRIVMEDSFFEDAVESDSEYMKGKTFSITTTHWLSEGGKMTPYGLDLSEESSGTQQLFYMSAYFKEVFEKGKTMIIDEFDTRLHPLLLEEIIRMFHDPGINKMGAQLIFTAHNVSLLDLGLFRRDQIFFTEKRVSDAASELFSLDDFSVRKSENIRNSYMYGRYGAIPEIMQGKSPWE
jgi:AAA15 family ATPase/GTPase